MWSVRGVDFGPRYSTRIALMSSPHPLHQPGQSLHWISPGQSRPGGGSMVLDHTNTRRGQGLGQVPSCFPQPSHPVLQFTNNWMFLYSGSDYHHWSRQGRWLKLFLPHTDLLREIVLLIHHRFPTEIHDKIIPRGA